MKRYVNIFSVLLIIIFSLCILAACGSRGSMEQADDHAPGEKAQAGFAEADKPTGNTAEAASPAQNRKIIKNAEISINVPEMETVLKQIEQKVSELGGYISESSYNNAGSNHRRCQIIVRIPAEKFEPTMNWLQKTGKVQNRRVYTEDVTEEYIDLEARIKNLEAQENRLQEILAKAKTVEEILKVEKELERVRGDLESLTGRLKFLQDRLSFSTINIYLEENVAANHIISTSGFDNIAQRSKVAFTGTTNSLLNGAGNMFVFFIGAIPLLLPLGIIGAAVWWLRKKYLAGHDKINQ